MSAPYVQHRGYGYVRKCQRIYCAYVQYSSPYFSAERERTERRDTAGSADGRVLGAPLLGRHPRAPQRSKGFSPSQVSPIYGQRLGAFLPGFSQRFFKVTIQSIFVMLLCMERTFEYRMRPNTTQEVALFTVLKALGVGNTSRNRSRYGRICAPTAASWPTAMSTRRSTYCRPGRGLRGVLNEYETRS
jgi:hypothetical protein